MEPRQGQAEALVPHHPAHKQEHGHGLVQPVLAAEGLHLLFRHPAQREVHPVFHDQIVPLIAQAPEVFPGAVADHPHFVAGGDIVHQQPDGLLLQGFAFYRPGNVDIKLGVIGKDQGGAALLPQHPGQIGGDNGAVGVEQGGVQGEHFLMGGSVQRVPGAVAHQRGGVEALIAHHREGVIVFDPGVGGHGHLGGHLPLGQDPGIVDHGVGHPVDLGRERIV